MGNIKIERVVLEVTHDEDDRLGPASEWEWQTMADATIGQDGSNRVEVRVVSSSPVDEKGHYRITPESDNV